MGEILGLDMSTIATLAIMVTFMDIRLIPAQYKVEMGRTLSNFAKWVKGRADNAQELKSRMRERLSTQKSEPEIDYSFDDVKEGRFQL